MVKFATLEYYRLMAEGINNDAVFSKSGLSTSMLYVLDDQKTDAGVEEAFLLNFENGKVTEVREAKPDDEAEFVYRGKYSILAGMAKGQIDGQSAVLSGMIKAKYPMMKALMHRTTLVRLQEISKGMTVEY